MRPLMVRATVGQTREQKKVLINLRSLGVIISAPLFFNLNRSIEPGNRFDIFAANGRDKPTLLSVISVGFGWSGAIIRSRIPRVGYVKQNVPVKFMDAKLYYAVLQALSV